MRVQILSDIHYDHGGLTPSISKKSDVVVIAGDISNGGSSISKYFSYLHNSTTVPIVIVLGNHDYYSKRRKFTFSEAVEFYKDKASSFSNIHILEKETFDLDGIRFMGTTLWTDYDKGRDITAASISMPCFTHIYKDKSLISAYDVIEEHSKCVSFIDSSISKNMKNIVITHHVPTFSFISDKYIGSPLNGAFCSELSTLILDKSPDLWICGHTHDCFTGQIGKCMLYCNPWGYPFERKNGFINELLVDI